MRSTVLIGFVVAALCVARIGVGGSEPDCIQECLQENQQAAIGYEELERLCRDECTVTRALQLVRSDDPDEYAEGIEILCNSDDPRAVDPLIAALKRDLEERTGRWALIIPALGAQRDEAAVPVLVETLKNPDDDWLGREMSADALGKIGSPAAIPALTTAAWRGDTRDEAITALALILDSRVVPTLISALDPGEDPETREAATEGLRRLGSESVPDLVEALGEHGPEHPETERRVWICSLLGEIGNSQAMAALETLRSDPDPAVALCASAAIEPEEDGG
jgi:HEAT repeat protein